MWSWSQNVMQKRTCCYVRTRPFTSSNKICKPWRVLCMISGLCICNLPVLVPEVPLSRMIWLIELVSHSLKRECCGPPSFSFFSSNGPTFIRKSFLYCSLSCDFLWMLPFPLLFQLVFCSTEFVYGFFIDGVDFLYPFTR